MNTTKFDTYVKRMILCAIVLAMLIGLGASLFVPGKRAYAASVVTYPAPPGLSSNDTSSEYTMSVNGQNAFVYKAAGSPIPNYTTFSTGSSVQVDVHYMGGNVSSAIVRPKSDGITPQISGRDVIFTMKPLQKVSVEIGNTADPMLVFADPLESNVPSGSNVVAYTTPGVYDLGSSPWCFPNGKNTLYIAGGVYLKGLIDCKGVSNISILGRGVFSSEGHTIPEQYGSSVMFDNSTTVTINGISLVNAGTDCCGDGYALSFSGVTGATPSTGVTVNDIALLNDPGTVNHSGINILGNNSTVSNAFFMDGDDTLIVSDGDSHDTFQNLVVWTTGGDAIQFGWNKGGAYDTVNGVDIIHYSGGNYAGTQAAIGATAYCNSANYPIHDVTVENVRVEGAVSRVIGLATQNAGWCSYNPTQAPIYNITFNNITAEQNGTNSNVIFGANSNAAVHDVCFQNLNIAGQVITSASRGNFNVGSYTSNISFPGTNACPAFNGGGTSGHWANLGAPSGGLADSPAVASQQSNEFDTFVRGSDNGLWQQTWNGSSWSGWTSLGGPTGNTFQGVPAAISWGPGYLDVFVRGTDNNLWQRWYRSGSWSSNWANLGAPANGLADSPAVAAQMSNEFDVFVRGSDRQLYQKSWTGSSWTGWTGLGGPTGNALQGAPAAISWGSGDLDVFVRGTDNNLWQRWYRSGSWSSTWANLGAPTGGLADSPAVASQGFNEFDVFTRGSDGALWQRTWNGSSWSSWSSLGGPTGNTFQGMPAAVSWGSGYLDVFVRGTDNNLWHRWYRNGVWS